MQLMTREMSLTVAKSSAEIAEQPSAIYCVLSPFCRGGARDWAPGLRRSATTPSRSCSTA
jgi:hypothetical protein